MKGGDDHAYIVCMCESVEVCICECWRSPSLEKSYTSLVPRRLGVWREESLVYTVCACASNGRIPPVLVTIPYTIVHQLRNELFIQVGIMHGLSFCNLRRNGFVRPSASHLFRFTPWIHLWNSTRSMTAGLQRGAT